MNGSAILYIAGVFFALGALDYLIGSRLGLGKTFFDTLQKMGVIMLGVTGIFSLAPVAAQYVTALVTPVADFLHVDPSVFPAMVFPIDMGGFQLSVDSAHDPVMGLVSGAVTSSICGATVGYTIAVAMAAVNQKFFAALSKGLLAGMVGIPAGCLAGALFAGVEPMGAVVNTMPLCVLAALLALGLFKAPQAMSVGFGWFGKGLTAVSVAGLVLQVLQLLLGITIVPGMAPLGDALQLVGTITFIMTGGMCLMVALRKLLRKPLHWVAQRMRINDPSVAGLLAASVSVTLVFAQMDEMDERGMVIVCAFCATCAHVIGGQLGVVMELAPTMVVPFLAGKLVSGAAGIAVAMLLTGKNSKPTTI